MNQVLSFFVINLVDAVEDAEAQGRVHISVLGLVNGCFQGPFGIDSLHLRFSKGWCIS